MHLGGMSMQDGRGARLKETESEQSLPLPLACHWETATWVGVGRHLLPFPPAPQQHRRGAPWQLAAPAHFVDEKGPRSSLRPQV